jgi:ATP-binding cassette subfamily C protein CydC
VWERLARLLPPVADGNPAGDDLTDAEIAGSVSVSGLTIDRGRGPVVDDLNFSASAGQTVLLNGPSGAGKTTIVLALAGQLETAAGDRSWRSVHVAGKVVSLPQHPYAFRGTVADNLRIAAPDCTDEEMDQALELVGLRETLGVSPLTERIGTSGRALSGGQLRRLAMAQALLAKPDVLLADEPTEGLDADSARQLLLTLRLSDPWMTMVVALHEQQLELLSWTPDVTIRISPDEPTAAVTLRFSEIVKLQ